ncbi:MAG: ferritin-like domain-containing protein [Polyangiales bacterium]
MSTRQYTLPVDQPSWRVPLGSAETVFTWEYDEGRDKLLTLYEKGKNKQWNANDRLDWSVEVDPNNPLGIPDYYIPIYGSKIWEGLDEAKKNEVRSHLAAWQFSQFLHGEQGALICTAKIVQCVPQLDSKFYAATQVIDEARHVEVYARYLSEKVKLFYPINRHLKSLLDQVVADSRWDLTNLGMQIIIEGLALAAFQVVREIATDPLAKSLTAYVMQDEARHVAFGRLALRDFYPQLTEAERGEREEFVVEACYLMKDRFLGEELWDRLGLDQKECTSFVDKSETMSDFRKMLFTRIVPTIKDIGLWGPKVRKAFEEMGVIAYSELDVGAMSDADEQAGDAFDAARSGVSPLLDATNKVIALGAAE